MSKLLLILLASLNREVLLPSGDPPQGSSLSLSLSWPQGMSQEGLGESASSWGEGLLWGLMQKEELPSLGSQAALLTPSGLQDSHAFCLSSGIPCIELAQSPCSCLHGAHPKPFFFFFASGFLPAVTGGLFLGHLRCIFNAC